MHEHSPVISYLFSPDTQTLQFSGPSSHLAHLFAHSI